MGHKVLLQSSQVHKNGLYPQTIKCISYVHPLVTIIILNSVHFSFTDVPAYQHEGHLESSTKLMQHNYTTHTKTTQKRKIKLEA
jgi:hypothetical protein